MNFDFSYFLSLFAQLIPYVPITLLMAVVSMVLAIVLGMVLTSFELTKVTPLRWFARFYISLFRGMPTLVQLFIIYYGLPQIFPIFRGIPALVAAIVGLGFKQSSYLAEIFRAAIGSVDDGQIEAGQSLNIKRSKLFFHVVLPQATVNALPATGNTFVSLIKETSLAFALGLTELFADGKMLAGDSFKYFETYLAVGVIYWIIIIIYTWLQSILENALQNHIGGLHMSLIKVKNLSVNIGQKPVLKQINLEVEEGTVTAFVGPSGSGKTTLLRTLNLLQEPSEGSVEVNGSVAEAGHISKQVIAQVRQNSAMVFQQFNLFKNKTALENVAAPLILNGQLPKAAARQRAQEVLEQVGLGQVAHQYPVTLSGGQQQRVSIARAIAVRPKVILLDEPTSALDPELVESVLQTIAALAREHITMVLVTHEMEFARQIADQAVFIEDGEILDQGPAKELLSGDQPGRISTFVNSLEKVEIEK